jgi:integrase/recombinase XerC
LFLGLRVSELVNLRAADVDLAQATILVNQGKGAKDRYVPISSHFLPDLQEWMRSQEQGASSQEPGARRRDGFVFSSPRGGRLSARTVQLRLEAIGKKAQIPRRLKPHTLRHTFATRLLERGANIREVQELMGHSSVATTEVYTHVVPERLRGAVDRL